MLEMALMHCGGVIAGAALAAGCQVVGGITERDVESSGGNAGAAGSAGQDGGGGAGGSAGPDGGGPDLEQVRLFGDIEDQVVHDMVLSRSASAIALTGTVRGQLAFGDGTTPVTADVGGDLFVASFDSQGSPRWARPIAASPLDWWSPPIVAIDDQGRSFVAVHGSGTIWFDQAHGGPVDETNILMARYSADGDVEWLRRFGDVLDQWVSAIRAGGDEIFLAGTFQGTLEFGGSTPALWVPEYTPYLAKLDAAGSGLWARTFENCRAMSIGSLRASALDATIVVAGTFSETCDLGDGVVLSTDALNTYQDCYVAKLSPTGNAVWGRRLESKDCSDVRVAVAASGEIVLAGSVFGTPKLFGELSASSHDLFAVKFASDGTPLWGRSLQRVGTDRVTSVDVDATGRIAIGGLIESGALAALLSGTDGALLWTKELGEPTPLGAPGSFVAFDSSGKLAVSGTLSKPADFGDGLLTPAGAGTSDVFVAKLSP